MPCVIKCKMPKFLKGIAHWSAVDLFKQFNQRNSLLESSFLAYSNEVTLLCIILGYGNVFIVI